MRTAPFARKSTTDNGVAASTTAKHRAESSVSSNG